MGGGWICVFRHPHPSSVPANRPLPMAPVHSIPLTVISEIKLFDGDGGSPVQSISFFDLSPPIPTSLGGISARSREVVDTMTTPHVLLGLPPLSQLPTNMRYGLSEGPKISTFWEAT